jgi:tyrosyl-tRNA synthetase
MIAYNLAKSKNEARRLILQGGVTVDEEKVTEPTLIVTKAQLQTGAVIKKGQKVFHRAILKG